MRLILWLGLLLTFIAPAHAQVDPGLMDAMKALRGGGHVIVFRHGATHADQADTDPLNIRTSPSSASSTTRAARWRKAIGEAMRKLQIPVGQVVTSQFNRAVETGTLLGFGDGDTDRRHHRRRACGDAEREQPPRCRRCGSSPPPRRPPAPTSSSSRTSRTSSMPSARTGSTCARARPRSSSRTAMAERIRRARAGRRLGEARAIIRNVLFRLPARGAPYAVRAPIISAVFIALTRQNHMPKLFKRS